MISINLSPEVEAALVKRAEIVAVDVPTFVEVLVTERMAAEFKSEREKLTPEEFEERLDRLANRHSGPIGFIDDSRESIYSGRGE